MPQVASELCEASASAAKSPAMGPLLLGSPASGESPVRAVGTHTKSSSVSGSMASGAGGSGRLVRIVDHPGVGQQVEKADMHCHAR